MSIHPTPELVAARRRLGGPVVVGVDPSQASSSALQWAAAEASRSASTLRLVTALSPSLSLPALASQLERRLMSSAQGLGVERSSCLVAEGAPGRVLVQHAEDASILVVGRRPFGATEHLLVGHTSLDVAASSPGPVVVVPEMRFHPGPGHGPVTVLLEPREAAFGSSPLEDPARDLLGFAFERAAGVGVPLVVVSVLEAVPAHPRLPRAESSAAGRCAGALTSRLESWRRLWPNVELVIRGETASPDETVHVLLEAAGRSQLVIIGRHSTDKRPAERLGSLATQLLRQSSRPIAVVPVGPVDPREG